MLKYCFFSTTHKNVAKQNGLLENNQDNNRWHRNEHLLGLCDKSFFKNKDMVVYFSTKSVITCSLERLISYGKHGET